LAHHTHQIHDFNLDFGVPVNAAGDRTFWTGAIPDGSVTVLPGTDAAVMRVQKLDVEDYFNLTNALAEGHNVSATASFAVNWGGPVSETVTVTDPVNVFMGTYMENQARASWSASEAGFTFVSDPLSTSTTVFSEIGRERNGVFFPTSHGAAASASASRTTLDAVALVHDLAGSSSSAVGPALAHAATVSTATSADSSQSAQSSHGPGLPLAGAGSARAVDQAFADLDSLGTDPFAPGS
jgi:hypothetical protein